MRDRLRFSKTLNNLKKLKKFVSISFINMMVS